MKKYVFLFAIGLGCFNLTLQAQEQKTRSTPTILLEELDENGDQKLSK